MLSLPKSDFVRISFDSYPFLAPILTKNCQERGSIRRVYLSETFPMKPKPFKWVKERSTLTK